MTNVIIFTIVLGLATISNVIISTFFFYTTDRKLRDELLRKRAERKRGKEENIVSDIEINYEEKITGVYDHDYFKGE